MFLIGQSASSRVEKIRFIADYPETFNRLYVCWREIMKNNNGYNYKNLKFLNCSRCEKCRRTMLAIYFLGKENNYKEIFDWNYFHKNIHHFIGYALANKKRKIYYEDIVNLMRQKGFSPSLFDRFWQLGLTLYYFVK